MCFRQHFLLLALCLSCFLTNTYAQVSLKPRTPPERWDQCQNCHRKQKYEYVPKQKKLKIEHADIQIRHGREEMSCNFCHDKNNHNFLFSAQKNNDFSNSALLCQKCHSETYVKWQNGSHGKRIDGWQKQTQLQCIECHNPHQVSFPKMKADQPPKRPGFSIPKNGESH